MSFAPLTECRKYPLKATLFKFLSACLPLSLLMAAPVNADAAGDNLRYRVELLVFRHTGTEPVAARVETYADFPAAIDLPVAQERLPALPGGRLPEEPYRLPDSGELMDGAWRRLQRLAGFEPLVRMTWEQNQVDYHPPVRVHTDEVIAEQFSFTAAQVPLDLSREDPLAEYLNPIYRLDGWVRLRRSRFLHLDLDLEYRLDTPAPLNAMPLPQAPPSFSQGGSDLTPAPDSPHTAEQAIGLNTAAPMAPEADLVEPLLRLHRLQQSRQVRSDQVHYFDSAYLGVLARVTTIADP